MSEIKQILQLRKKYEFKIFVLDLYLMTLIIPKAVKEGILIE